MHVFFCIVMYYLFCELQSKNNKKMFYYRSTFSAEFCVLRPVSLKPPSLSMKSNNYLFSKFHYLHQSWKRLEFHPIVKPFYPYSSSSVESLFNNISNFHCLVSTYPFKVIKVINQHNSDLQWPLRLLLFFLDYK